MFFSFCWDLWWRSFAPIGAVQESLSSECCFVHVLYSYCCKAIDENIQRTSYLLSFQFDNTSYFFSLLCILDWRNIEYFALTEREREWRAALDTNVHLSPVVIWPLPTLDQNLTETCAQSSVLENGLYKETFYTLFQKKNLRFRVTAKQLWGNIIL